MPNLQEEWDSAVPIKVDLQSEWDSAQPLRRATDTAPETDVMSKYDKEFGFPRASAAARRLALETGGAVTGGIVGAGVGSIPGGTAAIPGGMAGAGIGYAGGKLVADYLDELSGTRKSPDTLGRIADAGKDFSIGALLQGAGESGVSAIKMAVKWAQLKAAKNGIPFTKDDILVKAKEILESNTGKTSSPASVAESERLAKEIPGYKPSLAEGTGDVDLIRLQQSLARQPGGMGTEIAHRQANREALSKYLEKNFPGAGSIDDVLAQIAKNNEAASSATKTASGSVAAVKGKLPVVGKQQAGVDAVSALEAKRIPAQKEVGQLYKDLPNEPITPKNTKDIVDELETNFRPGDEDVYPSRAIARIKEAINPPKDAKISQQSELLINEGISKEKFVPGFQDLHSLRKDIGRQAYDAMMGARPNRELAMKLNRLKGAIDADIEAGMGASNDYVAAREAYAEYAKKFRSGAVEQVLRRGNQASGRAVPDALIAPKLFTPDGADDLIRAIGKNDAALVMEGHAANDLLSKATNATTGELNTTSLNSWIAKNRAVLDKFGIADDFTSLSKAQATLDAAKQTETAYGKSVAAKMLNADPEKAISVAMSGAGGRNTGETMQQLIDQVKSNPSAVTGLKNAFKDFIIKTSQNTADAITGGQVISNTKIQNVMGKYDPAMKVLYGEKSAEYAALQNVQKAVETSYRAIPSPLGGGSNTVEQANTALDTLAKVVGMPGLKLGPGGSFAVRLAQRGLGVFTKLSEQEVTAVLRRAMYDPELAKDLLMVRRGVSPDVVSKSLGAKLISMGFITARPTQTVPEIMADESLSKSEKNRLIAEHVQRSKDR